MQRILALLFLALAGCAAPTVILNNDATGEVARCGGGVAGSVSDGRVGHSIVKTTDEECVRYFEAKGFKRVYDRMAAASGMVNAK